MSTEAQINANRENAKHSTGPRTVDGKAKVRRNAARHGLCCTIVGMSDENQEDLNKLLDELTEEHRPQSPTESLLVYKMALNMVGTWRAHILLTERLDKNDTEDDSKQVSLMLRYFNTADRAFNRNLNDLRKLQKERRPGGIGFVSPFINFGPIQPVKPPENPVPSAFDPEIKPLDLPPFEKSTGEPPKRPPKRSKTERIPLKKPKLLGAVIAALVG
jgi:hypothetical protein